MNAADMEDSRQVLRVELGARGYDIHIGAGLIAAADDLLADCLGTGTVFIVTDDIVASHYLASLQDALGRLGRHAHPLILPAGEATKSFTQWQELCESMLAIGAERGSTIIALGGGVIGDLAGFAAATLLRGVDFVQIPTTLLAQVDSSVGGKTAINTGHGKNLVGAFYQPKRVLIDTAALDSLPPRELRAGYAETVKYGLIGDAGFFEWLERHGQDLLAGDPAARRHAIAVSCAAKATTVRADEREKGQRALLNFGHTFAHAFEAEAGYDGGVLHGEAVAAGMLMALELSRSAGLCDGQDVARVRAHFAAVGLPDGPRALGGGGWSAEALYGHMLKDKKVAAGRITFVLATAIGEAMLSDAISREAVIEVLAAALDSAP